MPSKQRVDKAYMDKLQSRQLWFGEIKKTIDVTRNGRMLVYIPEISGTDTSDSALFDCAWSSPFAGATQISASPDNTDPSAAQTSYGMWMRPPDPGTQVVVGLIYVGVHVEPVILSCLFHSNRNFMVPGIPSGNTGEAPGPVTEVNMNSDPGSFDATYTPLGGSKVKVKSSPRAKHPLADSLFHQGLSKDFVRGQSTSGARREDISEVFGILTPGSRQDGNPGSRNPGHQFVMDDSEDSSLVRLRTGQGMQILLNDTNDVIYIVNKRGTGYIEIDGDGNIDVFGRGSYNVRTMGDLNLRADQNINIEAGQDVNIKAANNAPHPFDEGRGLGGIVSDPEMALDDPTHQAKMMPFLTKGDVNIEGFNDVTIQGQNIEIAAMPRTKTGQLQGLHGALTLKSADSMRLEGKDIIGDAVGRVSQQGPQPGNIMFTTEGIVDVRGLTATLQGTNKLNLEGALVDIATSMTPPVMKPALKLKATDRGTKKKELTLFGFDLLPIPVPLPKDPDKQIQGKSVTGLGLNPAEEIYGGLMPIPGGVKTIISRMPQPEPSGSKKDKPFKGGFKAK